MLTVHRAPDRAPARLALGAALGLHALVLAGLLSHAPARQALREVAPLMVDLIQPRPPAPRVEPPPPQAPPRPRPIARAPLPQPAPEPLPVLVAPAEAPAPVAIAPQPAPQPAAVPPPVPAPLPVTAPVFDAAYLDNPAPVYPAIARRLGEQGRVVLRVLVNARGGAEEVQVRTSSGWPRLDESALATVRRWKFVPARRGDEAVAAWVLVPIAFRLEE